LNPRKVSLFGATTCQGATVKGRPALENIRIAIGEYLAAQPEIEKRFGTRVTREEVTV